MADFLRGVGYSLFSGSFELVAQAGVRVEGWRPGEGVDFLRQFHRVVPGRKALKALVLQASFFRTSALPDLKFEISDDALHPTGRRSR